MYLAPVGDRTAATTEEEVGEEEAQAIVDEEEAEAIVDEEEAEAIVDEAEAEADVRDADAKAEADVRDADTEAAKELLEDPCRVAVVLVLAELYILVLFGAFLAVFVIPPFSRFLFLAGGGANSECIAAR